MELSASQVVLGSEQCGSRGHSSLPLPQQVRTTQAHSTHAGFMRGKILPQTAALKKTKLSSQDRRSQSSHAGKGQERSLLRYRKLDMTAGDVTLGGNPLKEYKRQALRSRVRATLGNGGQSLGLFLSRVQQCEGQFVRWCHQSSYNQAEEVIVRLLNYSVDFNLPQQMLRALKILADLNLITSQLQQAFFYYDQTRQASLLLQHSHLLVQALLGMADCCGRCGREQEGIKILKKALEYSWVYQLEELELRIYDEIGKLHYHLGDLQRAKQYHSRHINALHQPPSSALRLLSAQRIAKAEQVNLEVRYQHLSMLLLVHLKAPIKHVDILPLPFSPPLDYDPVRSHFDLNSKYFAGEDVATAAKQLLDDNWFFRDQIQDPSLPQNDDGTGVRPKRFAYLDFQLNQQLRRLEGMGGLRPHKKKGMVRSHFAVKESLEEQIARKIKQPPLAADWYEKIVRQINRDHRNKLLNVRDAVRIRGFNRKAIPAVQSLRQLYNTFFQRWRLFNTTNLRLTGA